MTALGQQELLELPARRRLIVPVGHGAVWGVDTAVARVSIGWARGGRETRVERGVRTVSLPDLKGGQRLAVAFETLRDEAAALVCAGVLPLPGLIVVEQASGSFRNLELEDMVGIVQGAMYAGAVLGGAVSPRTEKVTSSSWKKIACGYGAISKPTKKNGLKSYGVLVVARAEWGYGGMSFDEADALGIAEAGRRDVILEER